MVQFQFGSRKAATCWIGMHRIQLRRILAKRKRHAPGSGLPSSSSRRGPERRKRNRYRGTCSQVVASYRSLSWMSITSGRPSVRITLVRASARLRRHQRPHPLSASVDRSTELPTLSRPVPRLSGRASGVVVEELHDRASDDLGLGGRASACKILQRECEPCDPAGSSFGEHLKERLSTKLSVWSLRHVGSILYELMRQC